ncbi:uncharacterized protein NECHADRAFT_101119 [Fusarium vanettenii 77-13-4]|uniref:Peptidase C14 caspase domain-containing protein n=1 Tax=Fusarium vanettenii (strain ATCC MYA-4622 / CBS 123669 / FGSC 9596 / NRRL 45880 / 77-13-4) TaxID=660122 RepID=C7YWZ0_FUSV7|nr:uncharacterized protein NECHADRAFT_101119 [Fusarium vanettenii 77-13-4]EEU43736.1 hypothetical protein NECHADRAFT_101119 [Fusarium vanettenii 77-13-4]
MTNPEHRSPSPEFTDAVKLPWVASYDSFEQTSGFHVGDKVHLRNSNGTLSGPYLIATLPAPGKCTLSFENGQPVGNGEIDTMSADTAPITHYALLVGIACYPGDQSLKGYVNDVQELEKCLRKDRKNLDIKTLTATPAAPTSPVAPARPVTQESCYPTEDEAFLPTYDNVWLNLNSIISRASSGDFVYIHFSGHGTKGKPGIHYLHGQGLGVLLKAAVDKGLKLTLVLDCCYSGSVVRNDEVSRCLPYDSEVDKKYPPFQWPAALTADSAVSYPTKRGASMGINWLINPTEYTVFAACGPSEPSGEIKIKGKHHGILSWFLIRAFGKMGRVGGRPHHIYAHLCARFRERKPPDQKPMLYGSKRLGFFEDLTAELYAVPIPIIKDGPLLLLDAGEAHGVCEGDKFGLCSVDDDQSEDATQKKEIFEVTNVRPLVSELSAVSPRTLSHSPLRKYPVRLQVPSQSNHAWRTAIQERPSLYVTMGDTTPSDLFTLHVRVISKEAYEIRDASNNLLANLPPPISDLEEDPSFLMDIIEHLVRYEMVKNLSNKSPSQNFIESFHVQLCDETSGKTFLPGCLHNGLLHPPCSHPECVVKIEEDAELCLMVRNEGGKGQNLSLHVFNLDAFWEVENMLRGDHHVLPPPLTNTSVKDFPSGTDGEWRKTMEMTIPQELKDRGETQCEDIIKVFVTRQPTSFMCLELPPIGDICGRRKAKSSRGGSQHYESDDWAVLNFRIRTVAK